MSAGAMEALYPGTCGECGQRIHPGDRVLSRGQSMVTIWWVHEACVGCRVEFRVVHMDREFGFDRTSADYPTREMAELVQRGRGGTVQRREVIETEWIDVDPLG